MPGYKQLGHHETTTLFANRLKGKRYKNFANKVNSGFLAFMKKAWFDTVMPLENETAQKKQSFKHYFLAWPQKGQAKKLIYVVMLGFIIKPLINFIRRPIEFMPNAAAETANYLKNQLINWAPTHLASQYLRSGLLLLTNGLQGLFKACYFLLRCITSPITSFQAQQKIANPMLRATLSLLSIMLSAVALVAIAYFAAPALLAIIPGAAPTLAPLINILAYPFAQLFPFLGLNLAPISFAVLTLLIGISSYFAINAGIEVGIDKINAKIKEWQLEEDDDDDDDDDFGFEGRKMYLVKNNKSIKFLSFEEGDNLIESDQLTNKKSRKPPIGKNPYSKFHHPGTPLPEETTKPDLSILCDKHHPKR